MSTKDSFKVCDLSDGSKPHVFINKHFLFCGPKVHYCKISSYLPVNKILEHIEQGNICESCSDLFKSHLIIES